MMIALVVGLLVSAAALALVASIVKSNADTVRATRLSQELRATIEVIARDMRRARSISDPIVNVGGTSPQIACDTITVSPATCVTYSYDCTSSTAGTFAAVALAGNAIKIRTGTSTQACPTSGTGLQLNSTAVRITGLTFTKINSDAYTITLTGQLANNPTVNNTATLTTGSNFFRSVSQEVRIRSSSIN
jgi:Tfp pilus assembly protein PilW